VWNPNTCPAHLLPWLAWAVSIDRWSADWSEARKRLEIAKSIDDHRVKGSRASVEEVLQRYDELLELVEWWETFPTATPHTFEIRLPLGPDGGARASREFVEAIISEVVTVKPARSHFQLIQMLDAAAPVYLVSGAMAGGFQRHDAVAAHDDDPVWATYVTGESGKPIQLEAGGFLELE